MKYILPLLIAFSTMAEPLPQWIAVVPVYPNPNLFDPQSSLDHCTMFGNMAGAVQMTRRDTNDDLDTFLIRMPIELSHDNQGFLQPLVSYYYSKIGEWVYTNYTQNEQVDSVLHDYTKKCLNQAMPPHMKKWFELKKRDEIEQANPPWSV